jgi:hypothetical protein
MSKCPICNASVKARQDNPAFPFCTARCKTIDLGKWLNEEYRIPTADSAEDEEDGSASEPQTPKNTPEPEEPVRH